MEKKTGGWKDGCEIGEGWKGGVTKEGRLVRESFLPTIFNWPINLFLNSPPFKNTQANWREKKTQEGKTGGILFFAAAVKYHNPCIAGATFILTM